MRFRLTPHRETEVLMREPSSRESTSDLNKTRARQGPPGKTPGRSQLLRDRPLASGQPLWVWVQLGPRWGSRQFTCHWKELGRSDMDKLMLSSVSWKWKPALEFLPVKSRVQGSLVGYSPWCYQRVGRDSVTKRRTSSIYIYSV